MTYLSLLVQTDLMTHTAPCCSHVLFIILRFMASLPQSHGSSECRMNRFNGCVCICVATVEPYAKPQQPLSFCWRWALPNGAVNDMYEGIFRAKPTVLKTVFAHGSNVIRKTRGWRNCCLFRRYSRFAPYISLSWFIADKSSAAENVFRLRREVYEEGSCTWVHTRDRSALLAVDQRRHTVW